MNIGIQKQITVVNSRGLKLAGIVHLPARSGLFPFMILLHGFTGYKEEKHIEGLAKYLEANGIGSVRFDASGSGESDGSFERDYRMTNYLDDIETIYTFIKLHVSVDIGHIGVWGQSMGGQMAILFAEKHSELQCVSAVAPVLDLRKSLWLGPLMAEWKQTGWLSKVTTRGGVTLRIPWTFVEDADRYDTLDCIQRLYKPIQFIVGLSEDSVSPSDVKLQYQVANDPKELIEIEGMSHDYKKFPDQIHIVNNHVMHFLRKYL